MPAFILLSRLSLHSSVRHLLLMLLVILSLSSCLSTLREYQLQHYHFYSTQVPEGFDQYCISLISDIHVWDPQYLQGQNQNLGPNQGQATRQRQARFDYLRLQEISRLLQSEHSQLLLLAGDYVSYGRRVRPDLDLTAYFAILRQATPQDGIVAVLGNHDHFLLPRNLHHLSQNAQDNPTTLALAAAGARLLVNERLQIPSRQNPAQVLSIVGIDDYMFGSRERQEILFRGVSPDNFVLALAHNPDSFDLFTRPELVDLAMAGHLHGGQVTLFGLAATVPAQRKYLNQPFQTPDFPVFVNNGLGASRLQFRLMAPPQIWTITLHRLREPEPDSYWRSESHRLSTATGQQSKVFSPRYPQQPYRLIRLSSPARSYSQLAARKSLEKPLVADLKENDFEYPEE